MVLATTISAQQLILNPGFEDGIVNWEGTATTSIVTDGVHGGTKALSATQGQWTYVSQNIKSQLLDKGKGIYFVSAFFKSDSITDARIMIKVYYTTDGGVTTQNKLIMYTDQYTQTNQWQIISGEINATWEGELTNALILYRTWNDNGFFMDDTELWLASEIPVVPDIPRSFIAIAVSGTQINLGWLDESNNADSFQLERSTDSANFSALATVTGATTYSDTGLDPQKTYYYRVAATNKYGTSDFTATISETVKAANEFTVMTWNIWKRSDIDSILTVINHISPDIFLVQEQGYNNLAGTTYDRVQTIMQDGGFTFGKKLNANLAIFSKFPVSGYAGNTSVSTKQHIQVELPNGKSVQIFNGWLHYLPDYMGTISGWNGTDSSVTPSSLIQTELNGSRYEDAVDFVSFIQNTSHDGLPVICGGDFNNGSHMDWIEATKNLNHKGLVVEWPISKLFTDNSFTDSYRIANPDPVAIPGFTWNQSIKDRIDYIYYKGDELEVKNSIDVKWGWTGVINTLSDHEPVVTTFRYLPSTSIFEGNLHNNESFVAYQVYPNPFNPTTNIRFNIPKAEKVTLKVYNVMGQEIATLVNRKLNAGQHSFEFNASTSSATASNLSSGVYYYRIEAGSFFDSKKMILLK